MNEEAHYVALKKKIDNCAKKEKDTEKTMLHDAISGLGSGSTHTHMHTYTILWCMHFIILSGPPIPRFCT